MEDKEYLNYGKLYFIKVGISDDIKNNYFSPLIAINSYSNYIKKFEFIKDKAVAITSNDELILWEQDSKILNSNILFQSEINNKNKDDFLKNYFLLKNPIFVYNKIKMKNISINKTMCLGLDINGNALVWGDNEDGLLGLGYDITSVKSPFIIEELKDIVEISLSENHAVVLNSTGIPFSWGLGKYGELGQERSIYNPFPQQMNTEKLYSKVFCGNLITCFLDLEGHFSYFGVIIRSLNGNKSTITIKNLLNDEQNYDGRTLSFEKVIEELEKDKIIKVVIGNGFIGLLNSSGNVYTLEFNDKLTKLYSKYFCYNITVSNNELYGLAKNNISKNLMNNENHFSEKTNADYYLCKWSSNFETKDSIISDTWSTTIWKIKENFKIDFGYKFLDINNNYQNNMIFLLNTNINDKKENINYNTNLIFQFESEYNDSYNIQYKRVKSRNSTPVNDISINGLNKSRSLSKYLNKTYNNFFNKDNSNIGSFNYLRNNNENNFGLRNNNIRCKNKSNTINIKERNKAYILNIEKNNLDVNNKNDNICNICDDTLELKEKELIKYRNEINNIINNYKNKNKNIRSLNLGNIDKFNENSNKFGKDNSNIINNQGIISKNYYIPNSGRNYKNSLNSKNSNNSKFNNDNFNSNKNNNLNNYNQKDIEEFFGKESSNIIKNDISDIIGTSNTNLNFLSPNIDISNKRYNNFSISTNLMINSNKNNNIINNDTLNLSGGKTIDDKKVPQEFFSNNGDLSPCFSKGQDSLYLINSISTGRIINIDKSNNDFFSDDGNKQSKNNIEIKLDKNELYSISDSDKQQKVKKKQNLNIEIQDSNYKSSIENYYSNKKEINEFKISETDIYNIIDSNKFFFKKFKNKLLKNVQNKFILGRKERSYINKKSLSFNLSNNKIKLEKTFDKTLNKKYESSPNILFTEKKIINFTKQNKVKNKDIDLSEKNQEINKKLTLFNNKYFDILKSNNKNNSKGAKNEINNNFLSKQINSNQSLLSPQDSFGNNDYIYNEGRKTGKFHKLSEDTIKYNKNIENTSLNINKESNNINNDNLNNITDIFDLPLQINSNKSLKRKLNFVKISKNTLDYFLFLIDHCLRKIAFKKCIEEIANYQKNKEKRYAVKMIYRTMKKRIIFYKIKFYRRIRKIYRFILKYEERLKMLEIINNKKIKV